MYVIATEDGVTIGPWEIELDAEVWGTQHLDAETYLVCEVTSIEKFEKEEEANHA